MRELEVPEKSEVVFPVDGELDQIVYSWVHEEPPYDDSLREGLAEPVIARMSEQLDLPLQGGVKRGKERENGQKTLEVDVLLDGETFRYRIVDPYLFDARRHEFDFGNNGGKDFLQYDLVEAYGLPDESNEWFMAYNEEAGV